MCYALMQGINGRVLVYGRRKPHVGEYKLNSSDRQPGISEMDMGGRGHRGKETVKQPELRKRETRFLKQDKDCKDQKTPQR